MIYAISTFLRRLKRDFFQEQCSFNIAVASDGSFENLTEYIPGRIWGSNYEEAYFMLSGKVPEEWKGCEIVGKINSGGETMVLDKNNVPVDALTDASVFDPDYKKDLVPLITSAKGGEELRVKLQCTANGLFGLNLNGDPDIKCEKAENDFVSVFKYASFGILNRAAYELFHNGGLLLSFMSSLPENDWRRKKLGAIFEKCIAVYCDDSKNAKKANSILSEALKWKAVDSALEVTAIGHAHIDTAWLWPLEQTVKKCARTFSSQISLMKKYKDYTFGASSAYHYEIVKEEYPELYEKIKIAVKSGRWELQGGMFVEADCNLTCGESLSRQFLYGKNFFMDEFGIEVKNLWLPDVFGYPGSLPQIIKKSGCDYFLTQKISWSDTNHFPYHSFYWQGIDGSRVLTHFPPEDTYNAYMTCEKLAAAQNKYAQSGENNEFMSLYGIGDGGCGPSAEFVERALRLRNFEGSPKVKFGLACEFFERLGKVEGLPDWVGELYLELHRGTLTNQAHNKRFNRKCEQLILEIETLFSMLPAEKYPQDLLDMMWKTLMINQFHDILPGSSVHRVYEESTEDYQALIEMSERLKSHAVRELSDGNENIYTLINTLSHPVCGLFELPWEAEGVETQSNLVLAEIPALGHVEFKKGKGKKISARVGKDFVLENELIKYEFDESGCLISAFDRELGCEFISGRGNVLSLYSDYPIHYEAWDIDRNYTEKKICEARCNSFKKIEQGKLFSRAVIEFTVGESVIIQTVTLKKGSKRLDFECEVDWNESRKMLRVGFDSAICPSEAAYDIQYGYIRRANHTNTSWEQAKFEVAHQRYFDLSIRDRGIALLNDCKYGCHVDGGFFDLALLRSSKYPDFYSDRGRQIFTYALLPHTGDLAASQAVSEAAALNRAPVGFIGALKKAFPIELISGPVELCALKKAAKSDDTVVRFVETSGNGGDAEIKLSGHSALIETNLIEWERGGEFKAAGGKIKLKFRPFEIRTFFLK